jgi:hypothetical protein
MNFPNGNENRSRNAVLSGAFLSLLGACGGGDDSPVSAPATPQALVCDDTLKAQFAPDANTTVVAVKSFRKGDALTLGTAVASTPVATADACMVKLIVGPGNPGPAGAPSTSPGIGMEIWLPARTAWNQRVHNFGSGSWSGGTTASSALSLNSQRALIAMDEGAVTSYTDNGKQVTDGSFAMLPDGTINKTLWVDFATRSLREQAVKTKALAAAFYGSAPKYSYFEGVSQGGRQGLNIAQTLPEQYDGIIANMPAINWAMWTIESVYPQVLFERDLGGRGLTRAQQDLMSNAAIAACDLVGGQHMGYIPDPSACKYDPSLDTSVLCASDGGTNATTACVTKKQATTMNKIWYGITADGTVPSPAQDNGWISAFSPVLPNGNQRAWGHARGTSTYSMQYEKFGVSGAANPDGVASALGTDMVALALQNPAYATPSFKNATGDGQSLWKTLSYPQIANAVDRGNALQPQFAYMDSNNPDLSAFKARGGKMMTYHGLADESIPPAGTVNYYNRVVAQLGGPANVQSFYRLYLLPGIGHLTPNGTSNPNADPPYFENIEYGMGGLLLAGNNKTQYQLLTDWVEKGIAPDNIVLKAPKSGATAPACAFPQKATYNSGDPKVAASYSCR